MDLEEVKRECEFCYRQLTRVERLDMATIGRFCALVDEHPYIWNWAIDTDGRSFVRVLREYYLPYGFIFEYPLDTMQVVVMTNPQAIAAPNEKGNTLLHDCCGCGAPLDHLAFLLQQFPDHAQVLNNDGHTPLHYMFSGLMRFEAGVQEVELVVGAYPEALRICAVNGNTPLHVASGWRHATLDIVRFMVRDDPSVCLIPNDEGKLPLDLAEERNDRGDDFVEFLAAATRAVAPVLTKRLRTVLAPPPPEIFRRVASFHCRGQGEIAVLKLAFGRDEIFQALGRDGIEREIRQRATRVIDDPPPGEQE